jgi:hypothetical protein
VLLLAALAAVSQPSPAQAKASVRIIQAVRATSADWEKLPPGRRREVVVRETDGRPVKIRLIEFE